jgi:hypothetical protein
MKHPSFRNLRACFFATALLGGAALADEPASRAPTHHQLMKDCMAKQKAAGSGKPSYELSADCRDIVKTEKENAKAGRKQADSDAKSTADKEAPR